MLVFFWHDSNIGPFLLNSFKLLAQPIELSILLFDGKNLVL